MRTFIVSALLVLTACGTSSYARVTAGRIGCPASKIELDEVERGKRGPQSWVAQCGQAVYVCSSNVTPDDARAQILCSELGRSRLAAGGMRADRHAHHHRRRD